MFMFSNSFSNLLCLQIFQNKKSDGVIRSKQPVTWIVLPYAELLRKARISRRLASLHESFVDHNLPLPRISWKLGARNLRSRVQEFTRVFTATPDNAGFGREGALSLS